MGVEQTQGKSQHTKLALEKKFSCHFCWDSNTQPFDHKSGAVTNELSQLGSILGLRIRGVFLGLPALPSSQSDIIKHCTLLALR